MAHTPDTQSSHSSTEQGNAASPKGVGEGQRTLLFDGVCTLCSHWAQFFIKRDPQARIKITSIQADEGKAILAHFGLPTDDVDTMVYVEDGKHYIKSSALLMAIRNLGGVYSLFALGWLCPRFLRDFFYSRIAKNRYLLFGKKESCMLPTAETKKHFL